MKQKFNKHVIKLGKTLKLSETKKVMQVAETLAISSSINL